MGSLNIRLTIFISLTFFWANSNIVTAQTKDTVIFKKSQLVETINWTLYQPEKIKNLPRVVLKLNANFGTRSARETVNEDFQKYFSHLRFGFVYDASVDFIFNDNYGFGLSFNQFRASYSNQRIKDRITFFGPAFVVRFPFDRSPWEFDARVNIGYIEYRGKQEFVSGFAKFYGAAVGVQFGIGVDYHLTPKLGIGINVQTTIGEITKFQHEKNGRKWTTTFEVEEGEDISQTGIGIGIRYYFN